MWRFLRVPNEIGISVMLLTLITCTRGNTEITFLYVMEGDETTLHFSFPCDSSKVTLRHGYKAPFYDSTNPEAMAMSHRHEIMLHRETEDHNCSLQLKLNHVLRSDEGGYILTAYAVDGNFLDDSKIGLRVDHPPGVASCEWLGEIFVDDWGSMLCRAPAGSIPGQIACYQNGQRMPPMTTPAEVGDVLQQTISVKYSQFAYCCAAIRGKLIDMCECEDYIWRPSPSGNIRDPCAASPQDSPPPQSLEGDHTANSSATSTFIPSTQTITERPPQQKACNSLYWGLLVAIGTLAFMIIILCVFLTVALWKIRQHDDGVIRQNGPYTTVPA